MCPAKPVRLANQICKIGYHIKILALYLVPSFKTVSIMSHVIVDTGLSPNPPKQEHSDMTTIFLDSLAD
jgi:hypothetical protein